MQTAKIGRSGQLNIPKEVRELLGVKPGHHVAFVVDGERVVLMPLTKTLRDFRGSVQVEGPQDFYCHPPAGDGRKSGGVGARRSGP